MTAYLSDFHVIEPAYEFDQAQILNWIALQHAHAEALHTNTVIDAQFHSEIRKKLLSIGLGVEKIQKRRCHLPDISTQTFAENAIYNFSDGPQGSHMKQRMRFFEKTINQVFEQFYPEECKAPSHIIHVTCTGYVSPSGAQQIISKRAFSQVCATHAYHMGCYASVPAIRMAIGYLHSSENRDQEKIDLVHTELCSLHMNPLMHEVEHLVVQSLFADGFIKYSIKPQSGLFKILALHEQIIPETSSVMSWQCADWGMCMSIAKNAPFLFGEALPSFVDLLKTKAQIRDAKLLFAIHPGGPKIIDQVKKGLQLSEEQVLHSREMLLHRGNMSSATIPHIWEKMGRDGSIKPGAHIVSLAFGPGLTISGAVLERTAYDD